MARKFPQAVLPVSGGPRPLEGQVALITGGARRIGRAIALDLAAAGARIALTYRSSRADAEHTAELVAGAGGEVWLRRLDVTREAAIAATLRQLEKKWGRLDLLVNNAGLYEAGDLATLPRARWDRMLAANLTGPFLVSQAALPLLRHARPGRIIHLASLGGVHAFSQHPHYSVSKAGLIHLTKVMARALAPAIQVNAVAPGLISTVSAPRGWEARLVARTPARRAGAPGDVAEAVRFFATCSAFITGQVLLVDGGLSLV